VSFSNESLIAQRLVTAFAFAGAASNWQSVLRVEDPPPDNDHVFYKIEAETAAPIVESINRVSTIRGLVLAGAYDVAAHAFPTETESERVAGRLLERSTPFDAEGREWIGQSYTLPFPFAVTINSGVEVGGCRVRFGVSPAFARDLTRLNAKADVVDSFLAEADLELVLNTEKTETAEQRDDKGAP
jgi:hypothetical protein